MGEVCVSPQPLTTPAYWRTRHLRGPRGYNWPRPGRYLLDCELDRIFRRHLAARKGGRLLEIGCGSSVWLPYFSKVFCLSALGVDYSLEGVLQARKHLALHAASATLVLADVFQIGEGLVGQFDAVFSLGVVEHFGDPDAVLAAFARFLAPGGVLITWVPNIPGSIVSLSRRLNPTVGSIYSGSAS